MVTEQFLVETPEGQAWRCKRCHALMLRTDFLFDPRVPPSNREEMELACRVLVQHVMALRPVPLDSLYEVCRPYFLEGWCVRDVLFAMNQDPDGEQYPTGENTWTLEVLPDRTLWRLLTRLRTWRWKDKPEGDDIMAGGWTSMKYAMLESAARQRQAHEAAAEEYFDRVTRARYAGVSGRTAARAVVMSAAARAKQIREEATARELAEQVKSAKNRKTPDARD